jgi:hypothetical protein
MGRNNNNSNSNASKDQYKIQQFQTTSDIELFLNDKTRRGVNPITLSIASDGSGSYVLLYTERIKASK